MSRRSLLLAYLSNSYKWLPYSYEYLYNSLIPEMISGKGVKNKAKVSKIYANGVIENQLLQYGDFADSSKWAADNGSKTISNNVATYTVSTLTADNCRIRNYGSTNTNQLYIANHKYLFKIKVINPSKNMKFVIYPAGGSSNYIVIDDTVNANTTKIISVIFTATTSSVVGTNNNIYFGTGTNYSASLQVGDTFSCSDIQLIDLTQMFGTGNEPTTLTDNRIQAILNRGNIAYNTGTYKGTDISEFSSEPYNLFDESDTTLRYNSLYISSSGTSGGIGGTNFSIVIPIQGGLTYIVERASVVSSRFRVCSINEIPTGSFTNVSPYYVVGDSSTSLTIPTRQSDNYLIINLDTNETNFINQLASLCIHIQGTRTGYAPHQTFSPLSFIYQGNGVIGSHDTMEITSTECVFTKNNTRVDLGSLDYSYISTGYFVSSNLNPAIKVVSNDQIVNAVCPKYIAITRNDFSSTYPNKTMRVDNNQSTPKMYFVNQSYTDATTFKTAMNGKYLEYELATPQVIRIPKKHLGIVDLGSLNYGMSSAGRFYINATTRIDNVKIPTTQDEIANIYCKEYIVINGYQASNYSTNLAFGINSNGYLYIRDDSCSSIAELQAKLSGVYLFYETENEVSDIADTIGIEKGGTITSNWFSYISNQLVQNGNFTSTSGYSASQHSLSVADNVLTILIGSPTTAGSVANILVYSNVSVVSGHKYLITTQVNPPVNGSCAIKGTYDSFPEISSNITINTWNKVSCIATATSSTSIDVQFNIHNTEIIRANDSFYLKNFMFIDLTLAFGSGKEPSTINDSRVQYILNLGYIPFDTTGTITDVPSQVLPNVDFDIKCK